MLNTHLEKEAAVLVVGGGLAGLWAAIGAREMGARVILADKGKIGRSGVSVFCHATMAPIPEEKFHDWFTDIVKRSGYLVDQELLEILLKENEDRLHQMEEWGVEFLKRKSGQLHIEESKGRKAILSYLYNGKQMMEAMRGQAERIGVLFQERLMITDLLTDDGLLPTAGRISGALGIHTRTGQLQIFPARSVVLTSGLMSIKTHTFYADALTGDGLAMAFRSGAELINLEFASGHAFGLWNRKFATGGQKQFVMNNARIINSVGERFMERYMAPAKLQNPDFDGHFEFGDICRAMAIEIMQGRGPIYFDLREWSEENIVKLREVLSATMEAFDREGIDLRKDLLNSTPFIPNYFSSCQAGIKCGKFGESIKGLYAAGAAAFVGHAVTPQAACNVFGYRAGERAAKEAEGQISPIWQQRQVNVLEEDYYTPVKKLKGVTANELFEELNKILAPYKYSFFKNEQGIKTVLDKLQELERERLPEARAPDVHELIKIIEFKNVLQLMKLVYLASLERKESRFSHFRMEYPYLDNKDWQKWIIVKREEEGKIDLRIEDIPFERYPLKPPSPYLEPSCTPYKFD